MRKVIACVALTMSTWGLPPAVATVHVPAYGVMTITDQGFGPTGHWTYDEVFSCQFFADGPAGIARIAMVACSTSQAPLGVVFSCPRMVVTRTTLTVVGALASCDETLDMGVGTSGVAEADLGLTTVSIKCIAYMDDAVLVPPYTVTCADPGLPEVDLSLPWAATS